MASYYRSSADKKTVTETLEQMLWKAAVKLRGNVAPADYKNYVLPLIFLRYLSLAYESRREELATELRDSKAKYDQLTLEDVISDPDQYKVKNVFVLPENARWSYVVANARRDDINSVVDDALEATEKANPKLRGLLPRTYATSNLDAENLRELITLFSKDEFKQNHGQGLDILGKAYEYFIGNFANTEGARGGEYFTPESVVRVLVECMEPKSGLVFDPACGSGGMFVQSDRFTRHAGTLSFYGQERIDKTLRLCRMNLILHGLDGKIELGDSLINDQHPYLRADYVIANPPFNLKEWGADKVDPKDARLMIDGKRCAVTDGNANFMWMLHFVHHMEEGGTAATVMANGALTSGVTEEAQIRKALVEAGLVDCIVQLPEKQFYQTGIPVCLWFFSKNRDGKHGFRERKDEMFFVDARKLGSLKPGSRRQKELSEVEIARIASAYHSFRDRATTPIQEPGFCSAVAIDDVRKSGYKLTPGVYVGSEQGDTDDGDFEQRLVALSAELSTHFRDSARLQQQIMEAFPSLMSVGLEKEPDTGW